MKGWGKGKVGKGERGGRVEGERVGFFFCIMQFEINKRKN